MRLALAVFLIVLGAAGGAFGYLQKTLWAPSDTLTVTASLQDPGPLVVVDPGVLNLYETPATLTIQGAGTTPVVVAEASAENVAAWVGDAAHTNITGLKSEGVLAAKKTAGESTVPDPRDSDLWEKQTTGEGHMAIAWNKEPGRTAWLIASDGKAPAPTKIAISWPADASTPWAVPLMLAGGILLVAGLILLMSAVYDDADRRRRRRARKDRRQAATKTQRAAALMIVGALGLAGCAPKPELPRPEPSAAPTTAPPVVNGTQLQKVLTSISAAVADGDAAGDASKLAGRVTGPALDVRKAAYSIRKKESDFPLPPAVAASPIRLNLTTASDSWPRVTTVITQGEGAKVPQLLNLLQEDARSPYQLFAATDLLPGATIPETPDPKLGSTLLAADDPDLKLTPEDTAAQYAKLLSGDKKAKDDFAADAYSTDRLKYQNDQVDAAKKAKGTATFSHKAQQGDLVATSTVDGGALVTAFIESESQVKPESVDGRNGEITIPATEAKLIGKKTTTKGVKVTYGETFLFYVPQDKSKKVEVLGASEMLMKASEV